METLSSTFVLPQIGEGRESRAPTRFAEVQRQRAGKAASPTGRANFSPSTSIRDVQELYRVITGDDVVSDKDTAAFLQMEADIRARYRSHNRDQLHNMMVRQTLLEKVGAAASELLNRRLHLTEVHVNPDGKSSVHRENPETGLTGSVLLSTRAAKRLMELDRVIRTNSGEEARDDMWNRHMIWVREQLAPILTHISQMLATMQEAEPSTSPPDGNLSPEEAVRHALSQPLHASVTDACQRVEAGLASLHSERLQEWLPGALLVLQGMANVAAEAWQARVQGARQLAARQVDTQALVREAERQVLVLSDQASDLREQIALHQQATADARRRLHDAQAEGETLRDTVSGLQCQLVQSRVRQPQPSPTDSSSLCAICLRKSKPKPPPVVDASSRREVSLSGTFAGTKMFGLGGNMERRENAMDYVANLRIGGMSESARAKRDGFHVVAVLDFEDEKSMDKKMFNLVTNKLVQKGATIKALLRKGNSIKVFVHCMQGINRSAAAVMAYLICHTPLTLEEAFQAIKSIRPQANIMQANTFYRELKKLYDDTEAQRNAAIAVAAANDAEIRGDGGEYPDDETPLIP